jgi:hypothetical protein
MPLPPDFQFSQANLQDYVDCPRRFQLRYLLELAWPAVSAEPADDFEAQMRDGSAFHRLVQQHTLGISQTASTDGALEPGSDLALWWENYLASPPPDLPPVRCPEVALSAPLGEHRLVAKIDLVAVEPGRRAVIVDWKTSAKRPKPGWLAARLQTRVYRYLLVRAGASLCATSHPQSKHPFDKLRAGSERSSGLLAAQSKHPERSGRAVPATQSKDAAAAPGDSPILPDQVEMIYWFANFPDHPERLPYDAIQYEADGRTLAQLAAEIAAREEEVFPLTADLKRCLFGPYRSLCGRGVEAGDLSQAGDEAIAVEEAETDWAESFDFEQIGEVAF